MPSRRDTLWGFLSPISPLFPLAYMLSSWQRLRHTVVSLLGDRVGAVAVGMLALSTVVSTAIAPDRLSAIGVTIAIFTAVLLVAYGRWGIDTPIDFLRAVVFGCGVLGLIVILARLLALDLRIGEIPILAEFAQGNARGNVLGMRSNGLAALLEPGAVGGLGLALLERKRRPLFLLAALSSAIGVLVTLSRGGALGVIVPTCLLLVYFLRDLRRHWKTVLIVVLVLAIILSNSPAIVKRLSSIADLEKNIQRIRIWTGSWMMVKDHLVFGSGPGNFGTVYPEYRLPEEYEHALTPHNLYLFVLSGWGLFGFLAFFGFLGWTAIRPLIRTPFSNYQVIALLMGLTFWVHVLVDDLFIPHAFMILGCVANQAFYE